MKVKLKRPLIILGMISLLCVSVAYGQQNKFKLKPGAQGKLCLECHDAFKEKLKNPFVHTPVKTGDSLSRLQGLSGLITSRQMNH